MDHHALRSRVSSAVAAGLPERAIEAAVVQRYLAGRQQPRSKVLRALCSDTSVEARDAFKYLDGAGTVSLDDVVQAFELLVPSEEAKAYGAVFTPDAVCRFMAERAIDQANAAGTVVDPACGCGALLIAALRRIFDLTRRRPRDIVSKQLFGMDISANSVERARVLLALACVDLGDDPVSLQDNLLVGNALCTDWGAVAGHPFDVVMANPPYVRYQHLPVEERAELAQSWSTLSTGNFNLYFAFFELYGRLAKQNGSAAYITPNHFFTAKSAGPLRQWMSDTFFPTQIIDFGSTRVFNALTYTAITLSDRRQGLPEAFGYSECEGIERLTFWDPDTAVRVAHTNVGYKPWILAGRNSSSNVDKIMTAGVPLSTVAHLRCGIKTLRDRLYMVDGATGNAGGLLTKVYEGSVYEIERSATRPLLRVSDLASEDDLHNNTLRVIFPYDNEGGRITAWTEERLRDEFPLTAAYLDAVRPELAKRDKGNKSYATWFAYGRTQGLVEGTPKLVGPEYAARPRYFYDSEGSLLMNGVGVQLQDATSGHSLAGLGIILNSGVCKYFVEQTARCIDGGFYAYQKPQLSNLGIVELEERTVAELARLQPGEVDDVLAEMYKIRLPKAYRRATST